MLNSKREDLAEKINQNASGEFYFMLCGKRRTYPTQAEALDALVEVKVSKF